MVGGINEVEAPGRAQKQSWADHATIVGMVGVSICPGHRAALLHLWIHSPSIFTG